MLQPYELFVGLRYTRAKRRNHFISFISLISILGIALGVTALITVMAVMNGFEKELRERIVILEKMLVKERQRAGQDLMGRILELESMLDVERRKVDDLPEMPEIAEVKMTTRKVVKAANAESVATTKKNLAKKMG